MSTLKALTPQNHPRSQFICKFWLVGRFNQRRISQVSSSYKYMTKVVQKSLINNLFIYLKLVVRVSRESGFKQNAFQFLEQHNWRHGVERRTWKTNHLSQFASSTTWANKTDCNPRRLRELNLLHWYPLSSRRGFDSKKLIVAQSLEIFKTERAMWWSVTLPHTKLYFHFFNMSENCHGVNGRVD